MLHGLHWRDHASEPRPCRGWLVLCQLRAGELLGSVVARLANERPARSRGFRQGNRIELNSVRLAHESEGSKGGLSLSQRVGGIQRGGLVKGGLAVHVVSLCNCKTSGCVLDLPMCITMDKCLISDLSLTVSISGCLQGRLQSLSLLKPPFQPVACD